MSTPKDIKINKVLRYLYSKTQIGICAEPTTYWAIRNGGWYVRSINMSWVSARVWREVMSLEILLLFPEVTFDLGIVTGDKIKTISIVTPGGE